MRIVHRAYNVFSETLMSQLAQNGMSYRNILYSVVTEVDGGALLYHTLTREILFLTEQEYAGYVSGDMEEELKAYLIKNWFLVPEEFDERTFFYVVSGSYMDKSGNEIRGDLRTATVFTTTGCNARCPYCYESGVKPVSMSAEVSKDAAKYIVDHMGNHVHLKWFGGEPLLNPEAINIICNYLSDKGVSYNASMTTNGYLANEFDAHTIRELWKIDNVQITLDGLAETYDSVKSYKNEDHMAFDRVIQNIEYLCGIGVFVQIRMNLSADNGDEIEKLIVFLEEHFAATPRISIYTNPLFEGCGKPAHKPTKAEREKIYAKYLELERHISNGPLSGRYLVTGLRHNQCMADDGHSSCILPDGRLSLCEHHCEDETFGTIWSDEYDETVFERWAEKEDRSKSCKTCFYFPQCFRLKHCETNPPCTDGLRKFYKFLLEQQAIRAYRNAEAQPQDTHELCCKINTRVP